MKVGKNEKNDNANIYYEILKDLPKSQIENRIIKYGIPCAFILSFILIQFDFIKKMENLELFSFITIIVIISIFITIWNKKYWENLNKKELMYLEKKLIEYDLYDVNSLDIIIATVNNINAILEKDCSNSKTNWFEIIYNSFLMLFVSIIGIELNKNNFETMQNDITYIMSFLLAIILIKLVISLGVYLFNVYIRQLNANRRIIKSLNELKLRMLFQNKKED